MPPTTRAAARAHAAAAVTQVLPNDLLARICSFLPPGDAITTVPRLNKAWAAAAAPRVAELRKVARALREEALRTHLHAWDASFSIPLWALQEAWPQLTRQQRAFAVARAAFHGDLATLRWALLLPQRSYAGKLYCAVAAAGGQLEALQCARALGCAWDKNTCTAAAEGGHLAVLQWARAQQPPCPWGRDTCSAAAGAGHLAVLEWARAQQPPCPWDKATCSASAEGGHLAVLQWARAQRPPCPWDEATCIEAARGGHLAVLQWARAREPPCPWDEETCFAAARGGHLAVIQWLRAQQPPCPWSARIMPPTTRAAARAHAAAAVTAALPNDLLARICSFLPSGDAITTVPRLNKAWAAAAAPRVAELRKVARALREEALRTPWLGGWDYATLSVPLWALQEAWPQLTGGRRKLATARAAFHGDLATLRWALPQRDDDGWLHCAAAAAGDQLEALQCARALGCGWGSNVCGQAARSGHLAVLQWLRAQQPPCHWDSVTCTDAAGDGHLAVLQWLRAQQPPCPWSDLTCREAAQGGHLAVLQWARAQQPPCPWNKETCGAAAQGGHLAVLQWLRAQQPPCPWDEWTCRAAAQGGHLAVLQWARTQQPPCPWDAKRCFDVAADAATAEWIRAQAALEGVVV
ncbi:hypothetical protein Rsub_06281 [Raphidocelis subcapitata]|uniref:F-box domain-containing protein n=1 Tax=Raphidocelis subcapitata TaxID=307507 RepID=A0A2V0P110_9CHLO|nr:hypothetical protein Rsub_06281 [Raphidocelis subcapitata]|eukprot:GBF93561.1 hypothetical protein Rsub_06281 [Raphidocelis subcapitata]